MQRTQQDVNRHAHRCHLFKLTQSIESGLGPIASSDVIRYHGGIASSAPSVLQERKLFDMLMRQVNASLLVTSPNDSLLYVADSQYGRLQKRMDHLACFLGGLLQMAATGAPPDLAEWYQATGAGLTATCHAAYARTKTHLGPDIMGFSGGSRPDGAALGQSFYWLRPVMMRTSPPT